MGADLWRSNEMSGELRSKNMNMEKICGGEERFTQFAWVRFFPTNFESNFHLQKSIEISTLGSGEFKKVVCL